MNIRLHRSFVFVLLLSCFSALPALAQSTRDEWLALRTRKQARHHRLPAVATRPGAFTITTIRFFSDPSGNLVGVGEARNDTSFNLSYSRINFRFLNPSGAELGREWTYLHGGVNARITATNAYETLLLPGTTGFFKIWTTIPAAAMASYTAESAGEELGFAPPRGTFSTGGEGPDAWLPRVFLFNRSLSGQQYSGTIVNTDPLGPFGPSGLDQILAYSVQISVAAYQDGVITDVQSATAVGGTTVDSCRDDTHVTGIGHHGSAEFEIHLARPANSIAKHSIEWHQTIVTPDPIAVQAGGGLVTFTVGRECGWRAASSVPWITIVEGGASSGHSGQVKMMVENNPADTGRTGGIIVSGEFFEVIQGRHCHLVFNPAVFLTSARHAFAPIAAAPLNCLVGASSSADWLRAYPHDVRGAPFFSITRSLMVDVEPNLTGVTRSAIVSIGGASFTVHQSAASRNVDFNGDGRLDLLWRHPFGWVAAWRMNGLQFIDGTFVSPNHINPDLAKPVAAADLDRNGSTDLLWQDTATGKPSFWAMAGTSLQDARPVTSSATTQSSWRIAAIADFNQDGDPDFVWQDHETGNIFVWFMRAQFPTSPMVHAASAALGSGRVADENWRIAGSGDFNRDGSPDLVWQHQGDGRIAIWKMTGTTFSGSAPLEPGRVADLEWKIRAIGDMNGDDMPDLIWQHRGDGRVAVWVMNGTTMMSAVVIAQLEDTNWEIVGPR
jgi:hypothetical protein